MTWEDLIIIVMASILAWTVDYLDTSPKYSCPKHCRVDHAHFPRPKGVGTKYLKEEDIDAKGRETQHLELNEPTGEVTNNNLSVNFDLSYRLNDNNN